MSITITYKDLRSPEFIEGVRRIYTFGGFKDTKKAYHAMRVSKLIDLEYQRVQSEFKELLEPYVESITKDKVTIKKDLREEFSEKAHAFHSKEVILDKNKVELAAEDFYSMNLAPAHFEILDAVVDFGSMQ